MDDLAKLSAELSEKRFDASVERLSQYENGKDMVIQAYRGFISMAQDSIRLHQQSIAQDSRIRDTTPETDLKLLELIWNNQDLAQLIIRQEMENIARYQEVIKYGRV